MKRTSFDFVGRLRLWAMVSGALLVLSLGAVALRGLNLSIEFVGGTSFTLEGVSAPELSAADLRGAAQQAGAEDVTAQVELDGDRPVGALVRTAALEPGEETAEDVQQALQDVAQAERVDVSFVGPSWGERISQKALEALVVFLLVVVAYITVRLEFKMAIAAVIALAHDIAITVGLYALLGFTVSPSTVIALLTILGYSLYDTVVVFDRIEESSRFLGEPGRRTYPQMVNVAMNDVLWRSVNTSLTSLLPVGALLVIGSQLLGAATLADLALALFIGMALGAYSSLFVAGPFLSWWKSQEPEHQRLERRAAEVPDDDPELAAAPSRAPITTDYVRGPGRRRRRR